MDQDLDFDTTIVSKPAEQKPDGPPPDAPRPEAKPADGDGAADFKAGDCLLGRYIVLEKLGQGMMGAVYHCHDKVSGVDVAVKSLPPGASRDPDEMASIQRNFKLVAGLRHENIACLRTLERDEKTGEYYLVMDFAKGLPLGRWMRKYSRSEHREKRLAVLSKIASALDHAHEHDIIHRDIKPDNIMADDACHVSVLDFGIASESYGDASVKNMSGTPRFKAPEQWMGDSLTPAADQYALGGIAFNMIVGEPPFDASTKDELRSKVLNNPVPKILKISDAENEVLQKVLSKRPEDRYPSCGAFVEALRKSCETLQDERETPSPPPSAQNRVEDVKSAPASPVQTDGGTAAKSRTSWLKSVLLLVLIAALIAFFMKKDMPKTATEPMPPPVTTVVQQPEQPPQPMPPPVATVVEQPKPTPEPTPTPVATVVQQPTVTPPQSESSQQPAPAPEPTPTSVMQPAPSPSLPRPATSRPLPRPATSRPLPRPATSRPLPESVTQPAPVSPSAYTITIRVGRTRDVSAENTEKLSQAISDNLPNGYVVDKGSVTDFANERTNEKGFKLKVTAPAGTDEREFRRVCGQFTRSVRQILGNYRISVEKSN